MASKGVPRLPKGLQNDVPGGDFEGKGGIPKVANLKGRTPKVSQEVILRGKGGIPEVVYTLEEGPPHLENKCSEVRC